MTCCSDSEADKIIRQAWKLSVETEDTARPKLDIFIPPDIDKMEFAELYKQITSQFSISEDSLDELFDFYFNAECLEKNCKLYDSILEHADNMIADIESHAHTTDRWIDFTLETLYFSTIVWKSDIGPIKSHRTIRPCQKWTGDRIERMRLNTMTTDKPIYENWFK